MNNRGRLPTQQQSVDAQSPLALRGLERIRNHQDSGSFRIISKILLDSQQESQKFSAASLRQNIAMRKKDLERLVDDHPKAALIKNLKRALEKHPSIKNSTQLARFTYWPAGPKMGKKIAQRSVSDLFRLQTKEGDAISSPSLDMIAGVARALDMETWELLVDSEATRRRAVERALGGSDGTVRTETHPEKDTQRESSSQLARREVSTVSRANRSR